MFFFSLVCTLKKCPVAPKFLSSSHRDDAHAHCTNVSAAYNVTEQEVVSGESKSGGLHGDFGC